MKIYRITATQEIGFITEVSAKSVQEAIDLVKNAGADIGGKIDINKVEIYNVEEL